MEKKAAKHRVDVAQFRPAQPPDTRVCQLLAAGSHHESYRVMSVLDTVMELKRRKFPVRLHLAGRFVWPGAEEEVAKALASGIRQRTGATIGLGVTGVAGPTGGSESKPVGRVYIAISDTQKTDAIEKTFRGSRSRIREWASTQALDLIRRKLM